MSGSGAQPQEGEGDHGFDTRITVVTYPCGTVFMTNTGG